MAAISQKTINIFSEIPDELHPLIIYHCNTNQLLLLSSVNKSASRYLSNEFFKAHYFKMHGSLEHYDKLYTILRSTHPSNCWKVMCAVMDPKWGPGEKNSPSIAKRVSPAFIEEALPKVVEPLNAQIQEAEQNHKAICGSGYDPLSRIDRVWKAKEKAEQNFKIAKNEHRASSKRLLEELEIDAAEKNVQIDEKQLGVIICRYFNDDVEQFVSCSYEQFVEKVPIEEISKDLFSVYQKMMKGSFLLTPLYDRCTLLQSRELVLSTLYEGLESEQLKYQGRIKYAKEKLNNSSAYHLSELTEEWIAARSLESNIKSKEALDKCDVLLQKLIDHPEEKTDGAFEEVRRLINLTNDNFNLFIWGNLYCRCANGVKEDKWSEKHFNEFLPELKEIIQRSLNEILPMHISEAEEKYSSHPNKKPIQFCRIVLLEFR